METKGRSENPLAVVVGGCVFVVLLITAAGMAYLQAKTDIYEVRTGNVGIAVDKGFLFSSNSIIPEGRYRQKAGRKDTGRLRGPCGL